MLLLNPHAIVKNKNIKIKNLSILKRQIPQ